MHGMPSPHTVCIIYDPGEQNNTTQIKRGHSLRGNNITKIFAYAHFEIFYNLRPIHSDQCPFLVNFSMWYKG